ncbi:MAG TPA: hypothetical protein VGK00_01865 [Anaerolineales bacterium]
MRRSWSILILLILVVAVIYLWPSPRLTFEQLYAGVPTHQAAALQAFRAKYPPRTLQVGGVAWRPATARKPSCFSMA